MEVLKLAQSVEPNLEEFKGNLRKIADIHIMVYKFYISFASRCDALVFDEKSRSHLEKCLDHLKYKQLTTKGIQQSRNNVLKILESINDLCVALGGDKTMLSPLARLVTEANVECSDGDLLDNEGSNNGGALDLLKHLKTLLNDPIDLNPMSDQPGKFDVSRDDNDGRSSPNSVGSHSPEYSSRPKGGIEPMTNYLLSDIGMDYTPYGYNNDCKKVTMTYEMNNVTNQAALLRHNTYSGLDNMIAKMKINVPIWNYNIDRVDTINSNNVMENMEVFEGNKSVKEAVLNGNHDHFSVGPFEVYHRNKVFVYLCFVNDCQRCHTTSLEYLKTHVKFSHGESEIDWNCTACELVNLHSISQKSLDGALDHLAKYHSMKTTDTLSKERLMELNRIISQANLQSNLSCCPVIEDNVPIEDKLDLFLCPNPGCYFSCNLVTDAFGHFSSINNVNLTFFNCRFCNFVSYSSYAYCDHLVKEHGNAKFRCGYCLYRTVSKANCVFHSRDVHPGFPKKIFSLEPLNEAVYNYNCRAHNSLKPFKCNESCNFATFVEQKFNSHLLEHSGVSILCSHCSQFTNDDIGELRDHLLLHGIGEYCCLYCNEAFNFISKAERHLHESHSSQYPYIVIYQDFESRSHSLKGKYGKLQKLDIGGESIIVVSIESDTNICSVEVISKAQSILIEDEDHCRLQLKHFMKNIYEPLPQVAESSMSPNIIDVIDITEGEERTDVKPRLRVRNIEELMTRQSIGEPSTSKPSSYITSLPSEASIDSLNFNEPELPVVLTPVQIKSEFSRSYVNSHEKEIPSQSITTNVPVTIKKEIESPKKRVKLNSLINSKIDKIKKEADNVSESLVDDEMNGLPVIQSVQSLEGLEESTIAAATLLEETNRERIAQGESITDIEINSNTQPLSLNMSMLSEADLENMPVDFDCELMPSTTVQDEHKSSIRCLLKYQDPDPGIVIISDGEDDEHIDAPSSFSTHQNLSVSSPGPSSVSSDLSSNILKSTIKISGATSLVVDPSSNSSSSVFVLLNPKHQNAPPAPRVEPQRPMTITLKKYRCIICDFTSEDRKVTEEHLRTQHSDRLITTEKAKTSVVARARGDVFVSGVSCPYCSDKVYEGVKGFERHHHLEHRIFSEIKCFLIFPTSSQHPDRLFACCICGAFCENENSVWQHTRKHHSNKLKLMKPPIRLKSLVALKKMVCPLYDCLEEFLQQTVFRLHLLSHKTVIACKTCTYIADSIEAFQKFHNAIDPVERLTHFYYHKSKQEIIDLCNVKRFSNPLYSLNEVILDDVVHQVKPAPTARKSTGAQYL